jgi:hypothetical protein
VSAEAIEPLLRGYVRDRWTYGTVMSDSDVSVEKAAQCLGFEPRDSSQALGVSHRTPWKHGRPGAGLVAVLIQTFKRLNVLTPMPRLLHDRTYRRGRW